MAQKASPYHRLVASAEIAAGAVGTAGAAVPTTPVVIAGSDGTNTRTLSVNSDGELKVNLETADIQIGAVEIKNADTDDRVSVADANTARTTGTHVLAVQHVDAAGGVMAAADLTAVKNAAGTTADAKADVDGNGTLVAQLRRIGFEADRGADQVGAADDALVAAGAVGTVSSKLRRLTTDLATVAGYTGAMGATTDTPVAYAGAEEDATGRSGISLWKRIANALKAVAASVANIPALGAAAAAASVPVALSTEDAAKVPSLGVAAGAASVPVALSNEDAAKVPALGQALAAASVPAVLPAAQVTDLKAVTEASAADIKTAVQLLDNAVGTHDGTVSTQMLAVGSKAERSTPTEVADGDDVRQWLNTFGALVLAGYDLSANGTRVFQDVQPLRRSSEVYLLFDAVSVTGNSVTVDLTGYATGRLWIECSESDGGVNASLQRTVALEAGDTAANVGSAITLSGAGQSIEEISALGPGLHTFVLTRTTGTITVKLQAQG